MTDQRPSSDTAPNTTPNTASDRPQRDATVETSAVQVTFFEDRAEVERRARCVVPAGFSTVVLTGLSVFIDDASLVVRIRTDGARILGSRVLRTMREVPKAGPGEIERMRDDLQAAKRKREEATLALDRASRARERVEALMRAWERAVKGVPPGGGKVMPAWRSAHDVLLGELVTTLDDASVHGQALRLAALDEERAGLRLDLGVRLEPEYEAAAEVQIDSQREQEIEVDLLYRTPCALWRPEHTARLTARAEGGHDLEIQTRATIWQATGEVWKGVRCKFSTARPAQSASAPMLAEDLLASRRKTDTERHQIVVQQREEAIASVGIDRGTRRVQEMPGVDDGGEPVTHEAARPCTIASDGLPFRVELQERRMTCTLDRIAYPERSEAVHFRATATLTGDAPLLAGPIWIARGSAIVGRSKTDFVGQGEPFELGMGVDDGLRVRRTVEEKRDVTPVIGTQKIQRNIRLFVSNLSGSSRTIHLVERFPVSEIDDVEVDVTSHRDGHLDTSDGFVHYDLQIPARGTRELAFEYRIEAASKVVI